MNLHRLLLLGIVVALSGCDNVAWGGIDVKLETSAERLGTDTLPLPAEGEEAGATDTLPEVEIGRLLLIGRPRDGQVDLTVVGQLVQGQLLATPTSPRAKQVIADRLSAGRRFTLFSEGSRVGTLFAESAQMSSAYCGSHPSIRGLAELVATAAQARQFIAIEGDGLGTVQAPFRNLTHEYDHRVASLAMMRDAIDLLGADFPPSILDIRRDIQLFQNPADSTPMIAATFVHEDRLRTGSAPAEAYSVFLLGSDPGTGYQTSFLTYRRVGDDGKGAPRFFDHLDWDGDGESEVLLEVMGESTTWVSALDQGTAGWAEAYHDACGLDTPRSNDTP